MKISRRIPARTETFEVTWFREWLKMSQEYRDVRSRTSKPMDTCWWCRHKFEDGDQMTLVCIKKRGNKVFCQKCADDVLGGGTPLPPECGVR